MNLVFAAMEPATVILRAAGWALLVFGALMILAARRVIGTLASFLAGGAILTGVVAFQIGAWGGNRLGTALFIGIAVTLGFAALVAAVLRLGEPVVVVSDGDQAEATVTNRQPTSSWWPALATLGAATFFVGVALSGWVVVAGVVLILVALGGWFAQASAESELWTEELADEVTQRLVAPAGIPIASLALLLFVAVALSRQLLATDKDVSLVFVGVAAVAVLGCAVLVALTPKRERVVTRAMIAVAVVGIGVAGVVGAVTRGEREFESHSPQEIANPEIAAKYDLVEFDTDFLEAPAGEFEITLVNNSPTLYHNLSIYTENPEEGGTAVFQGGWALPGQTVIYFMNFGDVSYINAGSIEEGDYFFRCDIHPNMQGDFVVTPPSAESTEGNVEGEGQEP